MTSTSHSFTRTDSFTLRTREKRKIADFDRVDSDRPWLIATCRAACTRSRVRRSRDDFPDGLWPRREDNSPAVAQSHSAAVFWVF